MALPSSGTITMGQVRTELKKTGSLNLDNTDVRKIAVKPSGTIKMSDLYGKTGWVESVIFDIGARLTKNDDEVTKNFSFQLGLNQRNVSIKFQLRIQVTSSGGDHSQRDYYISRLRVWVSGLGNNEKVQVFYKWSTDDVNKTIGNCSEYEIEYTHYSNKMFAEIKNVKFFIQ